MNAMIRRFCSEGAMLIGVVILLASAERSAHPENFWLYVILTLASGVAGLWSLLYRGHPLLSVSTALILGVVAFVFLIVEWGWRFSVPTVLALAHFMILICITKWLQSRTHRDDAMLLILLLLLLVVGGIVGGSLLFPLVLAIYAIAGCQRFIAHYLENEAIRSDLRNAQASGFGRSDGTTPHNGLSVQRTGSLSVATVTLGLGVVVFVAIPRVGAGMFGQVAQPATAGALSGFARAIEFTSVGAIEESDQPIMRLTATDEYGTPVASSTPLYLRGEVLDRYVSRSPRGNRNWSWRRSGVTELNADTYQLPSEEEATPSVTLFPNDIALPTGPMLIQKFCLEPSDDVTLFACYPPIEIISRNLSTVRKWNGTQILQTLRPVRKQLAYTIKSPAVPAMAAKALAIERGSADVPPPIPPEIASEPREQILSLIDEQTRGIGPLTEPGNRLAFARRLEAFLQSDRFSYSLQPPPLPDTGDPVSSFLLVSRKGHCEYFASGLALMCQLKGVPARVVIGYLANEYNSFGGFHLIRKKHAHAWVEVFVPGLDWVTLDPTPLSRRQSGGLAGLGARIRAYLDFLQFQWADGVLSFDAETRRRMLDRFAQWLRRPAQDQRTLIGGVVAFIRELFGWRLDLSWHERLVYWVFTLLVILLVLLLTYVVVSVGRRLTRLGRRLSQAWHAKQAGRSREVEFYHRYCRFLADVGVTRRPDQTPAEFAADLAARHAILQDAPVLVRCYYDVAFGGHTLSPEHRGAIEAFLRRLRNLTAEELTIPQTQ